ncbi:hypothetical protein BDQ12DRAFT_725115 [Crucibulum laeve]|uniref:ATPase dynein-related AAA domain-containing protein n=1 Tax=Crucibulum laeve TaxID=68775 RepID=A0A5C3LVC5_9AGAR|nr:hypothetical protein BDQ12DRAFT_725115 [Crucibulum laeve]
MHNVSIKVHPDSISYVQPSTPARLPTVTIDSPRSVRSPPRSPRLSGLLLALRDVIGDEPEEEEGEDGEFQLEAEAPEEHSATFVESANWSAGLPTLVNDSGSGTFPDTTENVLDPISPSEQLTVGRLDDPSPSFGLDPSDEDDDDDTSQYPVVSDDQPAIPTIHSSPDIEGSQPSDLLSPVDLSHLHLTPFQQDHTIYPDAFSNVDWQTPAPLLRSPPRSPALSVASSSTFEILAFPFGSPSARVLSPRLGAFLGRSPRNTPHPPPELDLDSPDTYRDADGEQTAKRSVSLLPGDTSMSSSSSSSEEAEAEEREQESFGSTAIWDADGGPTAVFLGTQEEEEVQEEVNQAIKRHSNTPRHFLNTDIDFVDGEPESNSSLVQDEDSNQFAEVAESSFDEDSTAHLAYLSSPTAVLNDGDTLNSLYDVYSYMAPGREVIADFARNSGISPPRPDSPPLSPASYHSEYSESRSPSPKSSQSHSSVSFSRTLEKKASSSSSTPSSALRERVFTPPPFGRGRSGTITADSPTSLASPVTSLESMERNFPGQGINPSSPLSMHSEVGSRSASVRTPDSLHGQDVEVEAGAGKKVPFGWRASLALGRSKNSSLISNRASRHIPPPLHTTSPELDEQAAFTSLSPTSPSGSRLRPLRLSTLLHSTAHTKYTSRMSRTSNNHHFGNINHLSISSAASVTSGISLSNNPLLSSPRSSPILAHIRNTQSRPASPLSSEHSNFNRELSSDGPQSAPPSHQHHPSLRSAPSYIQHHPNTSVSFLRSESRSSEPAYIIDEGDEEDYDHNEFDRPYDETIRRPVPIPTVPHTAPVTRPASAARPPMYAIATPRPTLMFAIASDDVEQVRQVLESGDAGPNDLVGPQSALEFTLTNDQLAHKMDIVKMLLAFGADPTVLTKQEQHQTGRRSVDSHGEEGALPEEEEPPKSLMDEMDPAIRYYVERADAAHTRRTSALIHRSFFRPLTRVRYELIGQDRALEQLFRVLSIHSRELSVTPIVVLLCGPSGHGKSLLARKFGSLLDVPTHTVTMTTLRSTHDLWQSYSMSPYEAPTTCTLAEFLINNEGKRCVVVLDEIEKTEDEKILWSLLMPWELGRCSFESNSRHIDVRNVIWLGTSNIGHDLVFEHRDARQRPEDLMSREEYVELMALLRPRVSERLGASVLSRVTTVLPFVPFTMDEKKAICSEALYNLGGEAVRTLSSTMIESVLSTALTNYSPSEGARSLYRAISNQLVDII